MDGEAGWWTTSGKIGLPPLARVMGVGRQQQLVAGSEGDQKKLFSLIHSLLGSKKNTLLPEYTSPFTLASTINMFYR